MFRALLIFLLLNIEPLYAKEVDVLAVEYPPYTTQNGDDLGISFRILDEYLHGRAEVQINPLFLPPARLQSLIARGQWCASFYPAPVENENVVFLELKPEPLKIGLYHRFNDPLINWTSLEQLKGYKVALLRANTNTQFFQNIVQSGVKPVFVDTVEQGIRMLESERVDAAMGDELLKNHMEALFNRPLAIRLSKTEIVTAKIGIFLNTKCHGVQELIEQ